jgi:tetratricopeptide (TPR) repeat protein
MRATKPRNKTPRNHESTKYRWVSCFRVFVASLFFVVSWLSLTAFALSIGAHAQTQATARATLDRAVAAFASGRVTESVAAFDDLVRIAPDEAPYLWQRGIALYYAGRYADCRAQFESHRRVNPNDVENAAWHFLCVARAQSPNAARTALLPVGPDARAPMREIYDMFRGTVGAGDVLAAARAGLQPRFYAHLYIGLYSEAIGETASARKHIEAAADAQYADAGGYMHMVAGVHLAHLNAKRQ